MSNNSSNNLSDTNLTAQVSQLKNIKLGLWGGISLVLISLMGIVETFGERVIIDSSLTMGYLLLGLIFLGVGYFAGSPPPQLEGTQIQKVGPKNILSGFIATLTASSILTVFTIIASQIENIRSFFLNVSPALLKLLLFNQEVTGGALILLFAGSLIGLLGAGIHFLSPRWRSTLIMAFSWMLLIGVLEDVIIQIFRQVGLAELRKIVYIPSGGLSYLGAIVIWIFVFTVYYNGIAKRASIPEDQRPVLTAEQRKRNQLRLLWLVILFMAILPWVLGSANTEIVDKIGLALLMGLGLNIVVGFAGLLDLGYVAFFAVGAYGITVFTSPSSPLFAPELSFWMALPIVVVIAAIAGVFVATPVLRMRGDYLAIVTLGFGEIARIIAKSEWFTPVLGGAQGILSVPNIYIGPIAIHKPQEIYYPILAFCLLAAYISIRLQNSRIGRAWVAMREDEPVAEAMGVNIVTAKLTAFITGAILASFSGALFATKIGSVFPASFELVVSIQVLVLIIVGGMGNIPGVVVGSLVIIGIPELLKEFDEYREFFYGIVLIVMMRAKPEGLLPSKIMQRELHEGEASQDSWVDKQATTTANAD